MKIEITPRMLMASWPADDGTTMELYGFRGEQTMMTARRHDEGRQSNFAVVADPARYGQLPLADADAVRAYAEAFRAAN